MFHTRVTAAWLFCSLVAGLHADDQTSLSKPVENPTTPSVKFLHDLRTPSTLLLVESTLTAEKAAETLHGLLDKAGHNVVTAILRETTQVPLKSDADWLYDTIVIVSNTLPRGVSGADETFAQSLLSFVDTDWTLPTSETYTPYGLRLPPSLLVFTDGSCATLYNETISTPCDPKQECGSTLNSGMLHLMRGLGLESAPKHHCLASHQAPLYKHSNFLASGDYNNLTYHGSSHLVAGSNARVIPLLMPQSEYFAARQRMSLAGMVHFENQMATVLQKEIPVEALVSGFQGERTWSRAIFSSSMGLCSASSNLRLCESLLQWATHRRQVFTWSNLRHWRLHEKFEWSEYEGMTIREVWTPEELKSLEMTRPFLYRIRDEIILGVDLWEVSSDRHDDTEFKWAPVKEPWVKFEYNMMETYVRKLLLPARPNVEQSSNLMRAAQKANFTSVGEMAFNPATHWIHYKAPKQHGIFKLVLKSVGRPERTSVWIESLMPLRTYKHDEDPRFVTSAFPFYSAVVFSSVLFAILTFIFPMLPAGREHHKAQ